MEIGRTGERRYLSVYCEGVKKVTACNLNWRNNEDDQGSSGNYNM